MKDEVKGVLFVAIPIFFAALLLSGGREVGIMTAVFGIPPIILCLLFQLVDFSSGNPQDYYRSVEIHHHYPVEEKLVLTQIEEYSGTEVRRVTKRIEATR